MRNGDFDLICFVPFGSLLIGYNTLPRRTSTTTRLAGRTTASIETTYLCASLGSRCRKRQVFRLIKHKNITGATFFTILSFRGASAARLSQRLSGERYRLPPVTRAQIGRNRKLRGGGKCRKTHVPTQPHAHKQTHARHFAASSWGREGLQVTNALGGRWAAEREQQDIIPTNARHVCKMHRTQRASEYHTKQQKTEEKKHTHTGKSEEKKENRLHPHQCAAMQCSLTPRRTERRPAVTVNA